MSMLTLPGLIDPHVHLRDPGQTEKEDFHTGTTAALAGGYTTIFDMPNNKVAITTADLLNKKIVLAKDKIVCDVGFYFGSQGDNLEEFEKAKKQTFGLKLYLNETTGNLLVNPKKLMEVFKAWGKLILVHAEEQMVETVLQAVRQTKVPTHFCHVSQATELTMIIKAKEEGLPITCGVTPHHLFLTENDARLLGPFGEMKPPLASKSDGAFLWKNLRAIDVVESDHAPHTKEEKSIDNPPGVPGLETTLPLLLTAVSSDRLTIDDIRRLCFEGPAKILSFDVSSHQSIVEIDMDQSYTIDNRHLFTKSGWSPFNNWDVKGKVLRVFLRGTKVFEDGKILVQPGFGHVLIPVG